MTTWDERFREGAYPTNPAPSSVLRGYVDAFPEGPALDVATGTGRNAVFLAGQGYDVEAVDQSREGLAITRENAAREGTADRLRLVQADVPSFEFPEDRYAVVTVSFYRAVDRFPDITDALAPGGYLFVEHHLRAAGPTPAGPSGDRYRFAANELLRAGLDLTVLHYDEGIEQSEEHGRAAVARLLARNSEGTRQAYPPRMEY